MGGSRFAIVLLCVFFLSSCQTFRLVEEEQSTAGRTLYTIVYVIHGDGGYLFHDAEGKARRADVEAVKEALSVAQGNEYAEVFIFHQRKRPVLLPAYDGRMYHFRGGRLLERLPYSRMKQPGALEAEASLFARHVTAPETGHVFFLYYGHRIPEVDGRGYHASYPKRRMNIHDFAEGLRLFRERTGGRFDLVLLSTCYGGTPVSISALKTTARYVIASPENLHLSYISSSSFGGLNGMKDRDLHGFLRTTARKAFEKLKKTTQTAITVVLYDTEKVSPFLDRAEERCGELMSPGSSVGGAGPPEPFDCAEDPVLREMDMSEGVEVFYQAPRFGRDRNKRAHSGWECWRIP